MSYRTAIMSSKIFMSISPERRKKILAAVADPVNAELVEQLEEYVDDEYKDLTPKSTEESSKPKKSEEDSPKAEGKSGGSPIRSLGSAGGSAGGSLFDKHSDELGGDEDWEDDSTSGVSDEVDDDTVEESTKVKGKKITADTMVLNPTIGNTNAIINTSYEIKGLLNAKADTAGVTRTAVKNDEMWIYYGDEINLNNVMSAVIESLNAACYNNLVFNRLARTDNAIVFTITLAYTSAPVKPVAQSDEK